jgi:hypothetical protein
MPSFFQALKCLSCLFVDFFGWLLGRWRGMLAAFLEIALYAALAGRVPRWCKQRL